MQLKNQIKTLIESGVWPEGKLLPTERSLSAQLGVSRTTVSIAYRELVAEGCLVARQGKGTFVASGRIKAVTDPVRSTYKPFVDGVLDRAIELGIGYEEFMNLVAARVLERLNLAGDISICFVECNYEQLHYFSKTLELGSGVKINPLLLGELRKITPEAQKTVQNADFVVTTLFHVDEVEKLVEGKDLIVIDMDPDVRSLVKIGRIPAGEKVALVCGSAAFASRAASLIAGAGIRDLELVVTYIEDSDQLREFLKGYRYVIATSFRLEQTKKVCDPSNEVIELIYQPDKGSIRILISAVWKKKGREGQAGVLDEFSIKQGRRKGRGGRGIASGQGPGQSR